MEFVRILGLGFSPIRVSYYIPWILGIFWREGGEVESHSELISYKSLDLGREINISSLRSFCSGIIGIILYSSSLISINNRYSICLEFGFLTEFISKSFTKQVSFTVTSREHKDDQ
jgi:hypothetical protein